MAQAINNKKFNIGVILTIALTHQLWFAQPGLTAPLGLPDNTAKIGYGAAYAYVSVDDPDGSTKDEWVAQPLNLVYTDWLFSDIRQWSELYYFSGSLDADSTNIGQDIESFGLRFSLQSSFRLTKSWSPWFGAGVSLSNTKYTARHTKDADGFLLQSYDDRDETHVSLLLNFISEWALQQNWSLAAKLEQIFPLSEDFSQFSATVVVLYRY